VNLVIARLKDFGVLCLQTAEIETVEMPYLFFKCTIEKMTIVSAPSHMSTNGSERDREIALTK
jgi:hypothetical protein